MLIRKRISKEKRNHPHRTPMLKRGEKVELFFLFFLINKREAKSDAATRYIYIHNWAVALAGFFFVLYFCVLEKKIRGPRRAVRRPIAESHRSYWGLYKKKRKE